MRARTCLKCREYIIIHTDNPVSQENVKKFEKIHLGHSVVTADYFEIKEIYKRFDPNKKVDEEKKTIRI